MIFTALTVKALSLKLADRTCIIFECGLQNGTLAIMITLTFLKNETMMLPGGLYSMFMLITGGLYLLYLQNRNKLSIETSSAVIEA